jgi:hypothetical protein
VDHRIVQVDRHLPEEQREVAHGQRRHRPRQDHLQGVMSAEAALPLTAQKGPGEDQQQQEVGHGER